MPDIRNNRRKYDNLTLEEKVGTALEMLDELMLAFPEGPRKHREVHEAWLEAKKAEADFWKELKLDIAKKGAWGLLLLILGLIFIGLKVRASTWFN